MIFDDGWWYHPQTNKAEFAAPLLKFKSIVYQYITKYFTQFESMKVPSNSMLIACKALILVMNIECAFVGFHFQGCGVMPGIV